MKKLSVIAGVISALIGGILIFLQYMGVLLPAEAVIQETGPYHHVYEDFTGPYHKTGEVFSRVYENLKKDGIETKDGLGIYMDNPQDVPQEKLRSQCGSVLEENQLAAFENVKGVYSYQLLPRRRSITVTYPLRNSLSYMMLPLVAYPVLQKAVLTNSLKPTAPPFEVYKMDSGEIMFVLPVE